MNRYKYAQKIVLFPSLQKLTFGQTAVMYDFISCYVTLRYNGYANIVKFFSCDLLVGLEYTNKVIEYDVNNLVCVSYKMLYMTAVFLTDL